MNMRLLCVGRRASDPIIEARDDYARRLGHYVKFDLVQLKESDKVREGTLLLAKIAPKDFVVMLDERGVAHTTDALVATIGGWQRQNVGRVVFVVGGACGLDATIAKRAQAVWRLSSYTLPHRLAHLLLLEQLYRAHSILRGEAYHRV